MRFVLFSIIAAVLGLAALAPEAAASDGWCDTDPVLVISTPQGAQVPVYVDASAWGAQHLPAAQLAKVSYTASPAPGSKGNGDANANSTAVTVYVTVPDDVFAASFPTRGGVSTGPFLTGEVFGLVEGTSSHTMEVHFILPLP